MAKRRNDAAIAAAGGALFARGDDGTVTASPAVVYPHYLAMFGVAAERASQYELEVARRCFTEDLVAVLGRGLHLRLVLDEASAGYALKGRRPGGGAEAGALAYRILYDKLPGTPATRLGIVAG